MEETVKQETTLDPLKQAAHLLFEAGKQQGAEVQGLALLAAIGWALLDIGMSLRLQRKQPEGE